MMVLLIMVILPLHSCSWLRPDKTVINLSFTPWVGYYPFYFAIEKQIPEKYNAELRVLETLSIQDFRRVNIKEHVDAFACSLMELTRTNGILEGDVDIVAFLDYSNGADVIVARKGISSMSDLQGKVVGFDWRSLGHYFLHRAMQFEELEKTEYIHRQVEQVVAKQYFDEGSLDAYVTYPPISTNLLHDENLQVIFDSSKIPYEIIDVLAMKKGDDVKKKILSDIWGDISDYINHNPEEYVAFVANLMNSEPQNIRKELQQVVMIDNKMQSNVDKDEFLKLMQNGCIILGEESATCLNLLHKIHFNNAPIVAM